jgi:hypothetical protein
MNFQSINFELTENYSLCYYCALLNAANKFCNFCNKFCKGNPTVTQIQAPQTNNMEVSLF